MCVLINFWSSFFYLYFVHLQAAFKCSICLDFYRNPVVLTRCGHSFCKSCIKTDFCPQCRCYGDKQMENYALQSVVELITTRNNNCSEQCRHIDIIPEKNSNCDHCQKKFCKPCLLNHKVLLQLETSMTLNKGVFTKWVILQVHFTFNFQTCKRAATLLLPCNTSCDAAGSAKGGGGVKVTV